MKSKLLGLFLLLALTLTAFTQETVKIRKKDRKRNVELVTTEGVIIIRLHDSTPLHRDNFIRLVKSKYLDSILFHRVIAGFMIQGGDPQSKKARPGQKLGNGGPAYTIPAEFRTSLFHQKGALAAARERDEINPQKASSGSQFYIVHGQTFNDRELDSIETRRLRGYKIPEAHRQLYRNIGGTPQLDQNYTVFGQVVKGQEVVDRIATQPVSQGADRYRPLKDVRIVKASLIKKKKNY